MRLVALLGMCLATGSAWAGEPPGACLPDQLPVHLAEGAIRCVTPLIEFGAPIGRAMNAQRCVWSDAWTSSYLADVPGTTTLTGLLRLTPGLDRGLRWDGQALSVRLDGVLLVGASELLAAQPPMPPPTGPSIPRR